MTDEQIRKLIGEERWRVIQSIVERERKIAEILNRQDDLTKAVRKVHRERPSTPLSKLLK
jgi:hypothetical protein